MINLFFYIFLIVKVSSSPMPTSDNDEFKAILNTIYFIRKEVPQNRARRRQFIKNTSQFTNIFYSNNMAKSYGLTLLIDRKQKRELASMRHRYSNFFTISGIFALASRNYHLCNTLENSKRWNTPRKKTTKTTISFIVDSPARTKPVSIDVLLKKIKVLNLSLVCIKKNQLNGYLTYNTLYFWLEHTLIVSVPICINVIITITMFLTFYKVSQLLVQQKSISIKRKGINESLEHVCKISKSQQQQQQKSNSSIKVKNRSVCSSSKRNSSN